MFAELQIKIHNKRVFDSVTVEIELAGLLFIDSFS